jgi:hypothetical protein
MLPEQLIVEVLGRASDTGRYMKEKPDKMISRLPTVDPGLSDHMLIMEELIAG